MEKIKLFSESEKGKVVLTISIIILVGLVAFQLGRLSHDNTSNTGLKVEYPPELTSQAATAVSASESLKSAPVASESSKTQETYFFASTRGKKYYPAGCSAGKTIKQENRIYFASRTEAQNAGYELSSSCK